MGTYTADFETTTNPDDCRVWAYAICDIDNIESVTIGNNIDDFMLWCRSQKANNKILFHNLKFDGSFIVSWLFDNGYKWIKDKKERADKTFTTLIGDTGMWYSIEVYEKVSKKSKSSRKYTFQDSLKLLNMPVARIAKTFKLPIMKGSIDYHMNRAKGHVLTDEEIAYIKNDVQIVAYAIKYLYDQDMTRMTIGSCALSEYKKLVGEMKFDSYFPSPDVLMDADMRQSYRGGFTFLNPRYAGKVVKEGIVLDVNSLYPSVMYNDVLPYGEPIYFEGKYEPDDLYKLYIQMFTCQFELKKDKIPTIQIKHNMYFVGNEYLESSNGYEVTLCLTNIDLDLFLEHYDVYNVTWHSGYKFKGTKGLFKKYIDKWSNAKIQAKKDNNPGLYQLSKLMLNSLYGKFATSPITRSQIPSLCDDGLHFELGEKEERKAVYLPMGTFITAYARNKTIRSAQKVYHRFIYADTDSLHLEGMEIPEGLEIDDTILGYWKLEGKFKPMEGTQNGAKYLRQKCYIENLSEWNEEEYHLKVTVAGMPATLHEQVTFDNFNIGATYPGKIVPRNVKGGVVLKEIDFTIRG